MLADAPRAQRTKIAERRKEELRKFGAKYDFNGDFNSNRSRTSNLKVWVYLVTKHVAVLARRPT